jgi:hypothetical protein
LGFHPNYSSFPQFSLFVCEQNLGDSKPLKLYEGWMGWRGQHVSDRASTEKTFNNRSLAVWRPVWPMDCQSNDSPRTVKSVELEKSEDGWYASEQKTRS